MKATIAVTLMKYLSAQASHKISTVAVEIEFVPSACLLLKKLDHSKYDCNMQMVSSKSFERIYNGIRPVVEALPHSTKQIAIQT